MLRVDNIRRSFSTFAVTAKLKLESKSQTHFISGEVWFFCLWLVSPSQETYEKPSPRCNLGKGLDLGLRPPCQGQLYSRFYYLFSLLLLPIQHPCIRLGRLPSMCSATEAADAIAELVAAHWGKTEPLLISFLSYAVLNKIIKKWNNGEIKGIRFSPDSRIQYCSVRSVTLPAAHTLGGCKDEWAPPKLERWCRVPQPSEREPLASSKEVS